MRRGAGLGIIILCIGIIYVLKEAGVLSLTPLWWSGGVLWPLVLVVLGGMELHEFRHGRIPLTALFMVVLGLGLSARNTGYFQWLNHFSGWGLFWSLLLIFIGLGLILPRRRRGSWAPVIVVKKGKRHKDDHRDFEDSDEVTFDRAFRAGKGRSRRGPRSGWRLLGDLSLGQHPWVLKDMELWNGIGDIRVNLATAHVDDGDYHLEIGGWIGDVRVLVPDTLPVAVDADVAIGDLNVFGEKPSGTGRAYHYQDLDFAESPRSCQITVSLKIGDVQIVRV